MGKFGGQMFCGNNVGGKCVSKASGRIGEHDFVEMRLSMENGFGIFDIFVSISSA